MSICAGDVRQSLTSREVLPLLLKQTTSKNKNPNVFTKLDLLHSEVLGKKLLDNATRNNFVS